MMMVRDNSAFFVPLALFHDVRESTAEMTMVTPHSAQRGDPGQVAFGSDTGAASSVFTFVTVVGIAGQIPEVSTVPPLLVSVFVVFLTIVAMAYLFAPLMILTGRESGMLFALAPLGKKLT